MSQRGKRTSGKKNTKLISKGYKVANASDFLTDEQDGYTAANRQKTDAEMIDGYIKKKKRLSKKKAA